MIVEILKGPVLFFGIIAIASLLRLAWRILRTDPGSWERNRRILGIVRKANRGDLGAMRFLEPYVLAGYVQQTLGVSRKKKTFVPQYRLSGLE
jgi:hypothetical protein